MRVDVDTTRRLWRQTVWGAVLGTIVLVFLTVYSWTQPKPDYASIRFLLLLLVLMPLALGLAYFIRRFIEGLAD